MPGGAPPAAQRSALRESRAPAVILRRAVVAASLVVVALFQSGLRRHLADPPLRDFDSDKVNASDLAYGWGMPDSPLSIASHAASLAAATVGDEDRAQTHPWLPLTATAAAAPAAVTSMRYLFHDMPVREKAWCPYCIVDALAHIAVLGFTVWESGQALRRLTR
jgi:uncharacterized membrane protein